MPLRLNIKRQIVLIADNVRSSHNVGSLFRTAEGLGISELVLSGYTPYPKAPDDKRLPHIADKASKQISKTALGAENSLKWHHTDSLSEEIKRLQKLGYRVYGLEQSDESTDIASLEPDNKIAIIVGNEVSGIDEQILKLCDEVIEIPMLGRKESFNVVQAAAMALFYLRLVK